MYENFLWVVQGLPRSVFFLLRLRLEVFHFILECKIERVPEADIRLCSMERTIAGDCAESC